MSAEGKFRFKTIMASFGMAALGVLLYTFYMALADMRDSNAVILERLSRLEDDRAKWATLTEHENELSRLRYDMELMRAIWEYHTGKPLRYFPTKEGEPRIDWRDFRKTLDEYRMEQKQQYENPPKKGH